MPCHIIKPSRSHDLYVEWSTIVDNIADVGTREHMEQAGITAERLNRADRTGTSALWPTAEKPYGGWKDEFFVVTNTERKDWTFFTLQRKQLLAYARAFAAGDMNAAEMLLTPIID